MAYSRDDVEANRRYFADKLRAERQKADVVKWVEGDSTAPDFVLLDTRQKEAYRKEHIQGARSMPLGDLDRVAATLPKDREIVTYCWSKL